MKFSKVLLTMLLSSGILMSVTIAQNTKSIPFQPTYESFRAYRIPDWFRDAKFGIWAHWGPQAVPRQGDWYAKKMYQEGSTVYKYHLAHYGHPSQFGYKDIIPLWKAEKWDADKLMALYKKAGAKYFVSMGTHHDNFFLWNSKIHKWNAVNMGPKKDVVGIWQQAAKKQGLRFGVSEHLAASYTWYQPSHAADTTGAMKGVPYDGANPKYADFYHTKAGPDDRGWLSNNPAWHQEWLACIKELIDGYHPDLLYSDSNLPFDSVGREMLTYYYNQYMAANKSKLEPVYSCKEPSNGMWVQDLERGVMDSISPFPWQTDTSIGDWFYKEGQKYKSSLEIIQMLVDIVSKNGNLLINIVQTPEGDIEQDIMQTLDDISNWTTINGEGIYGSRPWKIFGENPSNAKVVKAAMFNEENVIYSGHNIRFTTNNGKLYAFVLGVPTGDISIKSLGLSSTVAEKIKSIELLGSKEIISWQQGTDALVITKPNALPLQSVAGFRISFKK